MQLVRGEEEAATLPLGFPCGSTAWSFITHEQEAVAMLPWLEYPNPYLVGSAVHPVSCIIHDNWVGPFLTSLSFQVELRQHPLFMNWGSVFSLQ